MRKEFCGFYSTSENDLESAWKDTSTIFVLDANCLLNLYRCEDGTREDILRVMQELAPRLWIPFQVGYEYQKNRRNVIHESILSLLKIKEELEKYFKQSILEQAGIKKHLYNILSNELSAFQLNLSESINTFIKNHIETRIKDKKHIAEHDFIRDRLDEIINDNIGPLPTQEKINEINKRGEERYENKIPPGFKDGSKKKSISYFSDLVIEDKFGDLYLWEQLIEKASANEIENVIFVTDDAKEDWVFIHKGINHGALESLKTEICKRSNLKDFRLINQLSFLREAQKYLVNIAVSNETLEEIKELALTTYNENEDLFSGAIYNEESENLHEFKNHATKYKDWYKRLTYHLNDNKEMRFFSESVLEEFEAISYRTSKNLDLLSNFRTELLESRGEELYTSIRRKLLTYYKYATSTANRIKKMKSNSFKYDTSPSFEIEETIDELRHRIAILKRANDEVDIYTEDLL